MPKARNNNILLVDDEPDVLDILSTHLEFQGYTVYCGNGALEGVALLARHPYFLICTDIAMPIMDGYDFIAKVKEFGCPSEIALMTGFGYNPAHTLVRIHSEQKYPVFFKPFEFKKPRLLDTVRKAFDDYHLDIVD